MNEDAKASKINESLTPERKISKLQEMVYLMFYCQIKGRFVKVMGKYVLELILFIQIISLLLYEFSLNNELNYIIQVIVEILLLFPFCPVIIEFIIISLNLLFHVILLSVLFLCHQDILDSKLLKYFNRKIGFVILILSTILFIPISGISILVFTCNDDQSSYCENQGVYLIMIIISIIQLAIYCLFLFTYDLLTHFHMSKENLFESGKEAFFIIIKRIICIISIISIIFNNDIVAIVSLILFALETIFELNHNYKEFKLFLKSLISAKFAILTIALIELAIFLFQLKNYTSLFLIIIISLILPFVHTKRIQLSKDFLNEFKTEKQRDSVARIITYLLKTFTSSSSSKAILKLIFIERGEEGLKTSKAQDNSFVRTISLQETKLLFLEFLGNISQQHDDKEFRINFCGFCLLYLKDPSLAYLNILQINSKHLGIFLNYKLYSILRIIERQKIEQKKTKTTIKLSKLMKYEYHFSKFIENIKEASNKSSELWEKLSEISPDLTYVEKHGEKVYKLYKEIHKSFKKIIKIFPNNAKIYEIYASFTSNIINNEAKSNKYLKKVDLNNINAELIDSLKEDLLGKIVTDAETPVLAISVNKSTIGHISYMNLKCSKSFGYVPNELNGLNLTRIISSVYLKDIKGLEQALVELKEKNKKSISFFENGLFFKTKMGYLIQYKLNILDFPSVQNNYIVLFGLNNIGKEENSPAILILSNSSQVKNINEKCIRLGILNSNLKNNTVIHKITSQISLDQRKLQIYLPLQYRKASLGKILENFQEDNSVKNSLLFNCDIFPIQAFSGKVIGFSLFLTQELKKPDILKECSIDQNLSIENRKFEPSECNYFEDLNKFMFVSKEDNYSNTSGVSNLTFFNSYVGNDKMSNFIEKVLIPKQNTNNASLANRKINEERKNPSSSFSDRSNNNQGKSSNLNLFQQFSSFQPKEGKVAFNELIKKILEKQSKQFAEKVLTYRFVSNGRFDLVTDIEKNIERLIEPESDDDSESVTRKKNSAQTINLIQSKLSSNKKLHSYLKTNTHSKLKYILIFILFFLLIGYMAALIVDCVEVTKAFNTSLYGLQVQYIDIERSRSLFDEMHYFRELNLSREEKYKFINPLFNYSMNLSQYTDYISHALDSVIDKHIKSTINFEIMLSSLDISSEMFTYLDEHTMEILDFTDNKYTTISKEINSYTTYLTVNSALYNYNMELDNVYIDFNFLYHNLYNPIYSDVFEEISRLETTLREQNNISINLFLAFNYTYISVALLILIIEIINSIIINSQTKFVLKLLLDVPAGAWLKLSDKAISFTIKIKNDEDSNKHFDDIEEMIIPRSEESRSDLSSMQRRIFKNWPLTLCKSITVISILVAFLLAYSISACLIKRNKMLDINEWTISIAEMNYPLFISIPTFEFLREAFIDPKAQIMYKDADKTAYEAVMNLSDRYNYFLSNQQDLKVVSDKDFENKIDDSITGDLCRFVKNNQDLYSFCIGYENGILREGIHASYSLFMIQMRELLGHLLDNTTEVKKNYTYALSNSSYNLYTAANEIMMEGFSQIYEAIYLAVQNSINQSILSYNIYTICMIFFTLIIGIGLMIGALKIIISKQKLSLSLLTLIPLDHIWKIRRISQFIFNIKKNTMDERE